MRIVRLAPLVILAAPALAQAGSITSAARPGTPITSAASPDLLAPLHNPAMLSAVSSAGLLVDAEAIRTELDITATRHGGIDPNTEAPYEPAHSEALLLGGYVGGAWPVLPNRVGVGLGITRPYQQVADYRGETDTEPPFTGHQRYGAILAKVQSLALTPAVGVQVVENLHVGASASVYFDQLDLLNAWDPMGTEGRGPDDTEAGQLEPYTGDVYYQYHGSGMHLGWAAGVYYEPWAWLNVGASWTHPGLFQTAGTGLVDLPELLGGDEADLTGKLEMKLAPVLRAAVVFGVAESLDVMLGVEEEFWGRCCSKRNGDGVLDILDSEGGSLGPEEGLSVEIVSPQYIPRRLENASSFHAGALWSATDSLSFGGSGHYQERAIPNFAVSAMQTDFEAFSAAAYTSVKLGSWSLGLRYSRAFPKERVITNSAWDVRLVTLQDDATDYVDERFSPQLPFSASANGTYSGSLDSMAISLRWEP